MTGKWFFRVLSLLVFCVVAFLVYMACCFQLFETEISLLEEIDLNPLETIKIYHSPSNAVSQPSIIIMKELIDEEKLLKVFERFENLDTAYIEESILHLELSNRLGMKDTFQVIINNSPPF